MHHSSYVHYVCNQIKVNKYINKHFIHIFHHLAFDVLYFTLKEVSGH